MTKQNIDSGFSVIEVLLILVILGILGFTGWFVYHAKQTSDKSYLATSSTVPTYKKKTSTNTATTTDPYVGWGTYTSKLEKVAMKYPSDWTIVNDGNTATYHIQGKTTQENDFTLESPTETLTTGKVLRANVSLDVATSGLSAGDCGGLVVHYIKPITVKGRNLNLVTLDSATEPGIIVGIYVTDEQGLHVGDTTSICQPSFASRYGNSNVFVSATFSSPPQANQANSQSDGESIELTEAEYNQSLIVQQELKVLESLSY